MNEPCLTCECSASFLCMRRITHVNESHHSCEWVMSHRRSRSPSLPPYRQRNNGRRCAHQVSQPTHTTQWTPLNPTKPSNLNPTKPSKVNRTELSNLNPTKPYYHSNELALQLFKFRLHTMYHTLRIPHTKPWNLNPAQLSTLNCAQPY